MFRISDIYDKFQDDNKNKKARHAREPQEQGGSSAPRPPEPLPGKIEPKKDERMDISSAVTRGDIRLEPIAEKARELYSELCAAAWRLYSAKSLEGAPSIAALDELINKLVEALHTDPRSLIKLSLDDYPRVEEYFYYHIGNVTILSLVLAETMGYERKELVEIGVAALLHDIGLIKYENVIETSKSLTKMEYDTIKDHPNAGLEALNKLGPSVTQTMRDVVYQEHERLDGSGYPQGLKGGQITEQAQIVGLIDVYEALTHQRPYMNKHKMEAIKSILGMKSAFDSKLVKALIERVGIFPVGVFVRLNTKEIGMVVENNTSLPFRPIVNIMYDTEGRQLREPKLVNLADNSVIFIEECTETPPQGSR